MGKLYKEQEVKSKRKLCFANILVAVAIALYLLGTFGSHLVDIKENLNYYCQVLNVIVTLTVFVCISVAIFISTRRYKRIELLLV